MYESASEHKNLGVETVKKVETKKSTLRDEEAALEKQLKELEAKIKSEKEKIKARRKELDAKADKEIAKVVRKWHSTSSDSSSLEESVIEILGDR